MSEPNEKMVIEIDNLTKAQKLAIEDMLAAWVALGNMGSSRWTAFYADGDGNFHPKVTVDGHKAEQCKLTDPKERWREGAFTTRTGGAISTDFYMMDFDEIAWALRKDEEVANEPPHNELCMCNTCMNP
jgi:hypothetical protein